MKLKNLFLVFYFALPVLIFVRIFQLTEMIDSETGFYIEGFESAGTYIAVGIGIAMIIFVILGRMNVLWPERAPDNSIPMSVISGIVALGLIFEFSDFIRSFRQELIDSEIKNPLLYKPEVLKAMIQERNILIFGGILYIILLLAALIFFVYYAWSNVRPARQMPIFAVFPVLWAAVRLGRIFMQYTGIADISENIFDIMMLCLMLMFWLFHARVLTGYGYSSSVKWVYGIGLSASMMGIICTLPRIYVIFFGGGLELHEASAPKLINVASAVYAWYFLFQLKKVRTISAEELRAREDSEDSEDGEKAPEDGNEPEQPEKAPQPAEPRSFEESGFPEKEESAGYTEYSDASEYSDLSDAFDIDSILSEAKDLREPSGPDSEETGPAAAEPSGESSLKRLRELGYNEELGEIPDESDEENTSESIENE